jgi:polysaccharide export outer membrane protein
MRRLLKIVFALICVSASGLELNALAQSDAKPPAAPAVNVASPEPAGASKDATPSETAPQATQGTEQLPPSKISKGQGATQDAKADSGKTSGSSAPATANAPYVIGPLDVLIVKVWNNTNLSGPYDVRSDGMLSMPLIGEVKADGLTAKQLKETLTERLGDFLHNPEVDVQIAKVNSKRYFVYGEVMHAGEFPLVEATTILDALANVGGFRDFANPKKIYVMRGAQKFNFNYNEVSKGKNLAQNIQLQNGDRIYVP